MTPTPGVPGFAARAILGIAILLVAAGCVAKPVRTVTGRPTGAPPWRIAVLPAQMNEKDRKEAGDDMKKAMIQRLASLEDVRVCMALQIPGESYEVIPLPVVDRVVPPGTVLPPGPEAIVAAARTLQADLVLVPETYSWRRRYYVLHGVSRVGITAKIFDGETGKLLFESMHEQVKNQGELKIPAGYLAVVAGPILGLQHIHMADMCRNVAVKIGQDMRSFEETQP